MFSFSRRATLVASIVLGLIAPAFAQDPPVGPNLNAVKRPLATIETSKGTIKVVLYPEVAPINVKNFVDLAKKGFYNGLKFHRVVPDFVIQGGDPEGTGRGGPGYVIKNENVKGLKHGRGALAMANSGRDTAGSQFYIVIGKPAFFLDEKFPDGVNKYTVFGQVVAGQDVAEKIVMNDVIKKVTVRP